MILISLYQFLRDAQICNAIYPNPLPQQHSLPAISLEHDGASETTLLDGSTMSLKAAIVTVLCWDPSMLVASALAKTVRDTLIGYLGPFGELTAHLIYLESEDEGPETETGLRSVQLQFHISYS